jgi:hypothetical protein
MSYSTQISSLEESQNLLDRQILQLIHLKTSDNTTLDKITALSDKKNEVATELRRLNRLQWEEDTQRVHFDDYR